MSFHLHISPETRFLRLPGSLLLESGERLREVEVAFRTWGTLSPGRDNAVVVCHALTGSADVDRWWGGLLGSGRAFDPEDDFVVAANLLGSCYGTTGPLSPRNSGSSGTAHWGGDFPAITVRDQVRLQQRLLDALGVTKIRLVIGGSLGGMVALEWALLDPDRVERLAVLSAPARHGPWGIALSELGRRALALDPKFRDGHYPEDDPPAAGLALARAIAMTSYRSRPGFEQRFGRDRRDGRFEVVRYLEHQGRKLVDRFDANSYLALLGAMDSHDVARGRGVFESVLRALPVPVARALLVDRRPLSGGGTARARDAAAGSRVSWSSKARTVTTLFWSSRRPSTGASASSGAAWRSGHSACAPGPREVRGELARAQVRRDLRRVAGGSPRCVRHRPPRGGGIARDRRGLGSLGSHLRDRAPARGGAGPRSFLARRLQHPARASSRAAGGGGGAVVPAVPAAVALDRWLGGLQDLLRAVEFLGEALAADSRLGACEWRAALGADLRCGAHDGGLRCRAGRRHRSAGSRRFVRRRLPRRRREPAEARGASWGCSGSPIPIVTGFFGARLAGDVRLFGRGGSDTSATAIGAALGGGAGRDLDRRRRCRDRRSAARAVGRAPVAALLRRSRASGPRRGQGPALEGGGAGARRRNPDRGAQHLPSPKRLAPGSAARDGASGWHLAPGDRQVNPLLC